jgi:hypothetical protein
MVRNNKVVRYPNGHIQTDLVTLAYSSLSLAGFCKLLSGELVNCRRVYPTTNTKVIKKHTAPRHTFLSVFNEFLPGAALTYIKFIK